MYTFELTKELAKEKLLETLKHDKKSYIYEYKQP